MSLFDPSPFGAQRVARRYQGAVDRGDVPIGASIKVIYSDGGVITASDLERLLLGRVGLVTDIHLSPSPTANVVEWQGIDDHGAVVAGQLVLHVAVESSKVISWAEITMYQGRGIRLASRQEEITAPKQLARIARMGHSLIDRLRLQNVSKHEIVAGLVEMVDAAEAVADRPLAEAGLVRGEPLRR
jgi:hypothetical protein